MAGRTFAYYQLEVRAGPASPNAVVDVEYFDTAGESLGTYGATGIAFAFTWKDVAEVVRTGLKSLRLDTDPCTSVSPMVDLS
jgi:hypothetical protein